MQQSQALSGVGDLAGSSPSSALACRGGTSPLGGRRKDHSVRAPKCASKVFKKMKRDQERRQVERLRSTPMEYRPGRGRTACDNDGARSLVSFWACLTATGRWLRGAEANIIMYGVFF